MKIKILTPSKEELEKLEKEKTTDSKECLKERFTYTHITKYNPWTEFGDIYIAHLENEDEVHFQYQFVQNKNYEKTGILEFIDTILIPSKEWLSEIELNSNLKDVSL